MDGRIRMSAMALGLELTNEQRRRREAFRAWHREPDAVPDPATRRPSSPRLAHRAPLRAVLSRVVTGRLTG